MKANYKKRMGAYLIDIIFLIGIFCLIYFLLPENKLNTNFHYDLNVLNESYMKEEITLGNYFDEYSKIIYRLDKNNILNLVINISVLFIYFVIVPFITKGKTFGKYILGIKIKEKNKDRPSILKLLIRNVIFNGLLYFIGNVILLLLLKDTIYFILLIILGIIQIILSLVSVFMVIYRKDFRGLHDILSLTTVIRGE